MVLRFNMSCDRSGRRVKVANRRLQHLGFNNLRIYEGSFKDWVARGGEVEQMEQVEQVEQVKQVELDTGLSE